MSRLLLLPALFFTVFNTQAQLIDFDSEAATEDFVYNLQLYSNEYIGPVLDAYGSNQVSGWQPSGEILEPFAFSIGVQATATFLRSPNTKFNFNEVGFTDNLRLKDPSNPELPTVLGGATEQELIYRVQGGVGGTVTYEEEIAALSGITTPNNGVPGAALQIGMGLPQASELQLRIIPPIKVLDVNHFLIGGGFRHDITQYFADEDRKFHTIIGAYYSYSTFRHEPEDLLEGENQEIRMTDHSLNLEAVASYDFKLLSIYGLVGYYNTSTRFDMLGTYSFEVEYQAVPKPAPPTVQEAFSTTDPISVEATNSRPRFAVGASFKLGHVVELSTTYSMAEYNSLSAMLAFKIGNGEDEPKD
ncbi:DUF6588 family protein [Halocola ammonii]